MLHRDAAATAACEAGNCPKHPPFGPQNELLAGPEWTRKFILACRAKGFDQGKQDAIIWHGTEERRSHVSAVRCDDVVAIRATWNRVVAGLATPPPDGSLVFEITKKKTKTVEAKYRLVGVAIAGAVQVEQVKRAFPGTRVA